MEPAIFRTIYHDPLLREDDYKKIISAHTKIEFRQGTVPLKIGEVAKEFYVIETGLFRSFLYDYHGNETTTGFYCSNELLIESFSLFQRAPSKENFQALTEAVVWKISYEAFQELLNGIEGLRQWGRNWATTQLFLLKQHSINALTVSATERYRDLIQQRPQIIARSPLKYIASYLGVTDTSLSRIRREIS